MAEKSYGFAIGNLRARENTLLKHSDMMQFAALKSTDSLAATLRDKGFGDRTVQADVPELLKADQEHLWDYLYEIAPERAVFDPFLLENDFHNVKVILKSYIRDTDASPMLLYPVTVDVKLIETAVRDKKFDLLPETMRHAAARGYEILTSSGDSQLCDGVIDAACMKAQLQAVSEKGFRCPLDADLIRKSVFFNNMKSALRAAKACKNAAFLDETLIGTDEIGQTALKNAALGGVDQVLDLLRGAGYSGEDAAAAFEKSPSDFERYCEDSLMTVSRRAKRVTMGVEPVIGYYMARRTEIKNIRIIYSGIKTGQPEASISGRLRELYG